MNTISRREALKRLGFIPFLGILFFNIFGKQVKHIPFQKSLTGGYVLGVGNSAVPWSIYDTDLMGKDRAYKSANFMGINNLGACVFEVVFEPEEANFEWREIMLFSNGRAVKRFNTNQGTKSQGMIWTLHYRIRIDTK